MPTVASPYHATTTRRGLRRSLCRESYWDFCRHFWETVIPEPPIWNWHMRVIANGLQEICERVFRNEPKEYDLVINVPPGSSKSTLGSILLLPWCWTRMPSLRFIGGSYDADLSLDLGNKRRRVVRSDLYAETFPEIGIRGDQDTKGFFANEQGGESRATSTGASIIGRHAHVHVVDDPINPAGIRSEAEMRVANEWLKETLPSRCVDQSITPQVLIMQRLGMDDPTANRLAMNTGIPVKHLCFPAEVSDVVKPRMYKHKYYAADGLLDPRRFPRRVLEIKKVELGSYGYAGQFEQRPVPLSGGMFLWEKVEVGRGPGVTDFEKVVRFWDKAATKEGDGAYTSGVLLGRLKDERAVPRFWVLDVVRGRWDTHTREKVIRTTAQMDHEVYGFAMEVGMEMEPGSGGKDSAQWSIQNLAGFRCYAERATGDKFERAVPFSDQVNASNVGIRLGPWNMNYMEEMKYFGPNCKYKDQIDASSGAFNRLCKRRMRLGAGGY